MVVNSFELGADGWVLDVNEELEMYRLRSPEDSFSNDLEFWSVMPVAVLGAYHLVSGESDGVGRLAVGRLIERALVAMEVRGDDGASLAPQWRHFETSGFWYAYYPDDRRFLRIHISDDEELLFRRPLRLPS